MYRHARVALITREVLAPFYQQFDFGPSFSMVKYIPQKKDQQTSLMQRPLSKKQDIQTNEYPA